MCSFGSSSQASAPTTQYTTQTTTAAPQAQAMYNQAWQQAQKVAQRPFQPYSYDPTSFVAPLNPLQMQAMGNISGYQGAADPYYQMAGGMAGLSGMTTTPEVVSQYMSPYMSQVIDPTRAAIEQQQAGQRSQQQAEQIKAGAFGQERGQLMRAVLAGQQNLGLGQALSPLYQTGYGQALQGAQADLSRQLQAAQIMGGLGTGYQQAGLAGAGALLGAGTLGQQTQQAGLQALYNQYLMQQQYPFQTAQYLSSTAAGLGPGYGGTTSGYQSSQQPLSYFGNPLSDPHLKVGAEGDEPEVIGQTNDGQDIYRYRVVNPDTGELGPVQIGLMADEVEKRRPDAIGDYKGFRTVDYEKATDGAARMGGGVMGRGDYADGGSIDDLVRSHEAMYTSLGKGLSGIVPEAKMSTAHLDSPTLTYQTPQKKESYGLGQAASDALGLYKGAKGLYGEGKEAYDYLESANLAPKVGADIFPSSWSGYAKGGVAGDEDVELRQGPETTDMPTAKLDAPTLEFASDKKSGSKESGGLGDAIKTATGAIGAAKTLWDIGSTVGPMLMALSDRRLKTGVRPAFQEGGETSDDMDRYLASLAKIETGGREDPYSVVGPHTKYGDPLGKYQVLESNLPQWSREAGLKPMSREEFLGNKEAQEAIARHKFGEYVSKTGAPEEAAAMWFSGPGYKKHMGARDVLGTSIPEYQAKFRRGLGEGAGETVDLKNLPAQYRSFRASAAPDEGTTTPVGVKPEGISGMIRGTAPEGLGEKALDFATSERFLVPLLTGLGTMASSGSRFLAPAILQGLGAGAKAYMEVPKVQAETQKIAEEAKVQAQEALAKKALTGKIGVETQRLASELYEKQWIPNVGWVVYDKSKPYSVPQRITDAEGNQLGAVGPQDVQSKPGTPVPEPAKSEPKVASALDWKPTLSAPQGTKIPGALNIALSGDLPKQQESAKKEIEALRNRAQSSYDQQFRLDEMEQQFRDLPREGFLQPGAYAGQRVKFAKDVNTAVTALGGKPLFDPSNVAAAEELAKDTTRLGFATAGAMGHEPGFIVQSAVAANPGMENTPLGFQRITAGLKEATKYEQDRLAFYEDYAARYGTLTGADKLFRQLNPPQAYARRAILSTIDPEDMAYLKSVPKDKIKANANEIDEKYGKGITKLILGEE